MNGAENQEQNGDTGNGDSGNGDAGNGDSDDGTGGDEANGDKETQLPEGLKRPGHWISEGEGKGKTVPEPPEGRLNPRAN